MIRISLPVNKLVFKKNFFHDLSITFSIYHILSCSSTNVGEDYNLPFRKKNWTCNAQGLPLLVKLGGRNIKNLIYNYQSCFPGSVGLRVRRKAATA